MGSLLTRTLSAATLALMCIFAIFRWQNTGLLFLTFSFIGLATFELARMLFPENPTTASYPLPEEGSKFFWNKWLSTPGLLFCLIVGSHFLIISNSILDPLKSVQLGSILLVILNLFWYRQRKEIDKTYRALILGLFGFVYVGILPLSAIELARLPNGVEVFLFFLSIVIAGDVGAYFVGSKLGRTFIAPYISPKKSLEGFWGGLSSSLLIGIGYGALHSENAMWKYLVLSITTGLVGQFGDFFESLIKRVANIKDSGTILPGHGGILDRIDGILFSGPIFLILFNLLFN